MNTGTIKQRNAFWQCVRGLCILAVVMIHCPSGIEYGAGTFPYTATLILRQFINFPVAVFFFLAGYFTNPDRVNKNYRTYVLTRGGVFISTLLYMVNLLYCCFFNTEPCSRGEYQLA